MCTIRQIEPTPGALVLVDPPWLPWPAALAVNKFFLQRLPSGGVGSRYLCRGLLSGWGWVTDFETALAFEF